MRRGIWIGWGRSGIGASAGSCGGGIGYRCGGCLPMKKVPSRTSRMWTVAPRCENGLSKIVWQSARPTDWYRRVPTSTNTFRWEGLTSLSACATQMIEMWPLRLSPWASSKIPTFSTPGSPLRCGRFRRWGGRLTTLGSPSRDLQGAVLRVPRPARPNRSLTVAARMECFPRRVCWNISIRLRCCRRRGRF